MKNVKIKKVIKDKVYKNHILLVIGYSNDYLRKNFGHLLVGDDIPDKYTYGILAPLKENDKYDYILYIPNFDCSIFHYSVLVHEIAHLTYFILGYAGVKFANNGANEAFTYLQEKFYYEIATEINNYIRRKNNAKKRIQTLRRNKKKN